MHIISLSSNNGYKLSSLLACFQQGFTQLIEHRTGIAEVMGLNPIEFQIDDITKMILLKLWDFFNCSEQLI